MSIYEIPVVAIDGSTATLEPYRGRTLLVVNVASRCGFTPQYAALEALFRRRSGQGLVVLGFPCNQFGRQEPGAEDEIREFCRKYFDVTFPLFAKIAVNGPDAHPLYRHLKTAQKGFLGREAVAWNFTKFLVDGQGNVLKRYAPRVRPETIEEEIYGRSADR